MYKLIDLSDFVRGTRQRSTIRSIFVNFNKKNICFLAKIQFKISFITGRKEKKFWKQKKSKILLRKKENLFFLKYNILAKILFSLNFKKNFL